MSRAIKAKLAVELILLSIDIVREYYRNRNNHNES
tara:strand:- start:2014 stop:2118 length:105 start_codon:yes stop_codon:yes gene_type:complete